MITFCRLRPATTVGSAWAEAQRAEGSTTADVASPTSSDLAAITGAGLLPVATDPAAAAAAWVVDPADALELAAGGTPWWQITVHHRGRRTAVIDALARSGAAFLRTGRSRVAEAVEICRLPGIAASVSVFVDSVDDAVVAVGAGATDLLLRAWATDDIGRLRDALAVRLVERSGLPVGIRIDEVRRTLEPAQFTAYLRQVDGAGTVRPAGEWAPGKDLQPPVPTRRISAAWTDPAWLEASPEPDLSRMRAAISGPLERALDGSPPSRDEIEALFGARGLEVEAIAAVADALRERAVGDRVTYVVNRNINYTNQCTYRCGFCAFSKGPRSLNLRGEPYLLETHEVARRAAEAWERGATEVCLQGGIPPSFTGDFYVEVVRAVKAAAPEIDIHGFTPLEVWQGAETLGLTIIEFLTRLRDAGLGTLPGTAAEILDDRVREHLCPDKIRTAQWAEVMLAAHDLGLHSTATIMFGHIDDPAAWANHLEVIRAIQRRTGGFTEFVPLPFVHMGAPIYLQGRARPGPTWDEVVKIHAVARIAFDGLIPNIQASWAKLGLEGGAALLGVGCNDMGGTLMDENISRAAGAAHGELASPHDIEAAIISAGRTPARRRTRYEMVTAASEA